MELRQQNKTERFSKLAEFLGLEHRLQHKSENEQLNPIAKNCFEQKNHTHDDA